MTMNVTLTWKWKWNESYLTRTRRGERKRRGKERTPTQHTWPRTGKPWKGKGRKTSGGGGGRKRLNQPTTAKPKPSSARAGPNLPGEGKEHMKKGTHGGLVNEMMHPHDMQIPLFRLNGLLFKSQPYKRLKSSPLNYVHIWTVPETLKRKKHHT